MIRGMILLGGWGGLGIGRWWCFSPILIGMLGVYFATSWGMLKPVERCWMSCRSFFWSSWVIVWLCPAWTACIGALEVEQFLSQNLTCLFIQKHSIEAVIDWWFQMLCFLFSTTFWISPANIVHGYLNHQPSDFKHLTWNILELNHHWLLNSVTRIQTSPIELFWTGCRRLPNKKRGSIQLKPRMRTMASCSQLMWLAGEGPGKRTEPPLETEVTGDECLQKLGDIQNRIQYDTVCFPIRSGPKFPQVSHDFSGSPFCPWSWWSGFPSNHLSIAEPVTSIYG